MLSQCKHKTPSCTYKTRIWYTFKFQDFPRHFCSVVIFLLFLQIELQRSSSYTYKVLESLFILMLSFPLLVLNLFSSFSTYCIVFSLLLFFLPTYFLLFRSLSILKRSWTYETCSQEESRQSPFLFIHLACFCGINLTLLWYFRPTTY